MIICGIKLTHDGAVAVIEDNKLLFSIEVEKINNNSRYQSIEDTMDVSAILESEGMAIGDIDRIAIDGWGGYDANALAIQPRLEIHDTYNILTAKNNGTEFRLHTAQYQERDLKKDVMDRWQFDGLQVGNKVLSYNSYLHVTGHIMSTYCSSPFSLRGESAYVLVWDGGMYPRLYYFDSKSRSVENLGPLFLYVGNIYTIFSQHFGPFKVKNGFAKDDLSIAGKVMAYIALGSVRKELFAHFEAIYKESYDKPMGFANIMAAEFRKKIAGADYNDEDILRSFHAYLENLLISKLKKKVGRFRRDSANLCVAGGCALNIKWNSAIRSAGIFKEVYAPPFPNDSGSALGAACAEMIQGTGEYGLEWNVYSGPVVRKNKPFGGWQQKEFSVSELAHLLHHENEPVVVLNDRAELGPRALGNRSIIAPATSQKMKQILNQVKKREEYRPVSPICLEDKAGGIFDPGTADPYMLFDHRMRKDWQSRIPAVLHLDGTSRLQTVSQEYNPFLTELLTAYEAVSGIPVLCNTSANYNGKGFFPDVYSATKWNQVNYVWCDNTLFFKENKIRFNH